MIFAYYFFLIINYFNLLYLIYFYLLLINILSKNSESTLTKCMDFLERKVLEIIQTNNEISKEEITKTEDPISNANKGINLLEKVSGNIYWII